MEKKGVVESAERTISRAPTTASDPPDTTASAVRTTGRTKFAPVDSGSHSAPTITGTTRTVTRVVWP